MSEKLYNGLVLPREWPPRDLDFRSFQPMRVPWLERPPEVIPIDLGRQLFVDDFLLEDCQMLRQFHPAVKYSGNPVFVPSTKWECNSEYAPTAIPKCGGVCYDERAGRFKMWYLASYVQHLAYAESEDGINWQRPQLDVVPGSNLVLPGDIRPDSGTVWLDRDCADPSQRCKMLVREANDVQRGWAFGAQLRTSADGVHWSPPQFTGGMGDRSTMFYNPFRRQWVQSIRAWLPPRYRCRLYYEAEDFYASGRWQPDQPVFWCGADCYDRGESMPPELYNLDATPYESLMLGFFQILKGPPNNYGEATGMPKLTELYAGYSRDGFHWHRPDRAEPLIGACRQDGDWEYGYVESTGGGLLVVGDEIWIYYSAYAGDSGRAGRECFRNGMYSNGATGLAKLRRDGFVSLRAGYPAAKALTRKLLFQGGRLFVNVNTAGSQLTVACCYPDNRVIPGFAAADCLGYRGNSTCAEIRWKDNSLQALSGQPVKFLFQMQRGDLYSFWVTDAADGASHGYCGAGKK